MTNQDTTGISASTANEIRLEDIIPMTEAEMEAKAAADAVPYDVVRAMLLGAVTEHVRTHLQAGTVPREGLSLAVYAVPDAIGGVVKAFLFDGVDTTKMVEPDYIQLKSLSRRVRSEGFGLEINGQVVCCPVGSC